MIIIAICTIASKNLSTSIIAIVILVSIVALAENSFALIAKVVCFLIDADVTFNDFSALVALAIAIVVCASIIYLAANIAEMRILCILALADLFKANITVVVRILIYALIMLYKHIAALIATAILVKVTIYASVISLAADIAKMSVGNILALTKFSATDITEVILVSVCTC